MILVQEKLDVIEKKRSNLFNWRGQFTPEFVEYILDSSDLKPNSLIADPFAGSGTVLIESAKKGHSSIGFEINPAAYQMTCFYKYSHLNLSDRHEFLFTIESKLKSLLSNLNGKLIYVDSKDYRTSYRDFINISEKIKNVSNKNEISFFMNLLFSSEKDKKMTIKASLLKSFSFLKRALLNLPLNHYPLEIHNCDARNIGNLYSNQIDLILTSPPYINVFNYHQNYRAVTESFKYNILNVAHSEFGSNRKNRGNRLLTIVQYCIDMEASFLSFWKSLSNSGKIVMVVGRESNVRKTPFYNGRIVLDLIKHMGGFNLVSCNERSFYNKFGKRIIEDIIIVNKNPKIVPELGIARNIALNHIKNAQTIAPDDVQIDFNDVLKRLNTVKSSPIYR